jgi:CO/xanthine dehydrogenase Mo-binding subunit
MMTVRLRSRLTSVTVTDDSGPAINPTVRKQQAEGCVMQGISRSLMEEVKWNANGILSRDWILYPVAAASPGRRAPERASHPGRGHRHVA